MQVVKILDGVSSILFSIYKNINKEKIQFDFLSPNKTTYEVCRKEIEQMGGKIFELNINKNKIVNKILLYKKLSDFLQENNYNIVHINSGSFFFNLIVAKAAKKSKVNKIIVHSHNTLPKKNKIKNYIIKICKPLLNLYATDFFACSQKAADDMFTKKVAKNKVVILKNGVDIEKFKFNIDIREKKRKELNIKDNTLVVGHVGRFDVQKNHKFLIDCFLEVHKKNENAILLLVGEGPLKQSVEEKVQKLNLEKNVIFLGMRKDVNELMQAMDVFVLPSLHEGLPISGIEAQTAGLKCIMSSSITTEVDVTGNVFFIGIEEKQKEKWCNEILKIEKLNRKEEYKKVIKEGYDIKISAKNLEKKYLDMINNDVKIYIATQKEISGKLKEGYVPIYVGADLKNEKINYLKDNVGDNISNKNENYCELTALYWMWKNSDANIIGLCHYRRYFFNNIFTNKLENILSKDQIKKYLNNYDIIVQKSRVFLKNSIEEQYINSHYEKDYNICREVIKELKPDYIEAFENISKGRRFSKYNMFITKKEIADEYAKWIFDILFEVEKRVDIENYSKYDKRIFGFLSERLFNVWLEKNKKLRIKKLYVNNIEKNQVVENIKNDIKNIILPKDK